MFDQSQPMRSVRYRMIAASLAMLVLLLSLASVSPELHDRLHAHSEDAHAEHHHHCSGHPEQPTEDSEHTDGHFCGVTLLDSGVVFTAPPRLPQPADLQVLCQLAEYQKVWLHKVHSAQSARGPPTLIVV